MQFLARVADAATEGDVVHAPDTQVQPIAAVEVARFVAAAATAPQAHGVVEVAGPEELAFTDAIARVLATRGDRRRVVADPDARYFGAVVRGNALLPGPKARIATLRLADWLASRGDKAAATAQPARDGGARCQWRTGRAIAIDRQRPVELSDLR